MNLGRERYNVRLRRLAGTGMIVLVAFLAPLALNLGDDPRPPNLDNELREFRRLRIGMPHAKLEEIYGEPDAILSAPLGDASWGWKRADYHVTVFVSMGKVTGGRLVCEGKEIVQLRSLSDYWLFQR